MQTLGDDTLAKPTPLPRRRWRRLLMSVAALLVLGVIYVLLLFYVSGSNLRLALAEADRLDPDWGLTELEARRPAVADSDNAALRVLAADKLLPAGATPAFFLKLPLLLLPDKPARENEALQQALEELAPAEPLQPHQVAALTAALGTWSPALEEVRRLADLPAGRFPANYRPSPPPSRWAASVPAVRRVAQLLGHDVLLRAEHKDADGALASCRALLNVARSIGDEPLSFSQIVRLQTREDCCRKIERALGQSEPSEHALAALQDLLELEEGERPFLPGARGLRAEWDRWLESLQEGEFSQTTLRHRRSCGRALSPGLCPLARIAGRSGAGLSPCCPGRLRPAAFTSAS
jgi:hypothetical protein